MSLQSAKDFLSKFKSDENLRKKIEGKRGEDFLNAARQEGFDFTREEIEQAGRQLSGEDLENVVGGTGRADGNVLETSNDCSFW
jgi:predicted ribosomally synthesized peptide with nif11-like leader